MVPGSLGLFSTVLANIATLAPSYAALNTIASPIPLDAPLITIVLFFKLPYD